GGDWQGRTASRQVGPGRGSGGGPAENLGNSVAFDASCRFTSRRPAPARRKSEAGRQHGR
ncbi:MAG: hypothetical protein ACJASV_001255, partial [Pseudorhodobacter sp.]